MSADISTLTLVGFVNPFDFLPGFLLPVFASAPGSNTQYLQAIDELSKITAFERAELHGSITPSRALIKLSVGEDAIFAFGGEYGDEIMFGTRSDLAPVLAAVGPKYRHLPALYVSISEFCAPRYRKQAIREEYKHLGKEMGSVAARAWRDSQVILPIVRAAAARARMTWMDPEEPSGLISVHSPSARRIVVYANGYDGSQLTETLTDAAATRALGETGVAENITISVRTALATRPQKRKSPSRARTRRSNDLNDNELWHSIELACSDIVDRGLTETLRHWFDAHLYSEFRKNSDVFWNYLLEWLEREPGDRVAPVLAALLSLERLAVDLLQFVQRWLSDYGKTRDAGSVYAALIPVLRAETVLVRIGLNRVARVPIRPKSKKAPQRLAEKAIGNFMAPAFLQGATDWVQSYPTADASSDILIALINLGLTPQTYFATKSWLDKSAKMPRAGRVMLVLLKSKTTLQHIDIRDVAHAWITRNPSHADVPALCVRLISAYGSPSDIDGEIFRWVRKQGFSDPFIPVMIALLKKERFGSEYLTYALSWVDRGGDDLLIAGLLVAVAEFARERETIPVSIELWLMKYGSSAAALPVFQAYVKHSPSCKRRIIRAARALAWRYSSKRESASLLAELVLRFSSNAELEYSALKWIENVSYALRSKPIILALLKKPRMPARSGIETITRRWIRKNPVGHSVRAAYAKFLRSQKVLAPR